VPDQILQLPTIYSLLNRQIDFFIKIGKLGWIGMRVECDYQNE